MTSHNETIEEELLAETSEGAETVDRGFFLSCQRPDQRQGDEENDPTA